MEHVEVFLNRIGLGQYAQAFEDSGYTSLRVLWNMDAADFAIFGNYVGMLSGHLQLLKTVIFTMKKGARRVSQQTENRQNTVPYLSFGRNNNAISNGSVGPANDPVGFVHDDVSAGPTPAATAAAAAAVPAKPTKRKASHHIQPVCKTSKEVRIQSLQHSTQQLASAMRDNKSGGKRIIYRCASVLSKSMQNNMGPNEADAPPKCDYCLYWGKKKDGSFHLNRQKSTLKHVPMCVAPQKVTRTELLADPKFVRHSMQHDLVSGKIAAKNALGEGGRLDGSVHKRTAKRASNDVKRYHDKDYDEDWSKLRQWGREYERKNNNSRFLLQINEETSRLMLGPWAHVACVEMPLSIVETIGTIGPSCYRPILLASCRRMLFVSKCHGPMGPINH